MKRIAIIDDHKLFSSGLALLLEDLQNPVTTSVFESVHDFSTSFNADANVKKASAFDLIVLDFYLPGAVFSDNISTVKQQQNCPIFVVSASPSPNDASEAKAAGAKLFINKNTEPDELIKVIDAALQGRIEQPHSTPSLTADIGLTSRQLEILILLAKGYSNKEIAKSFDVSPETIKSHLKTIYSRIEVQNRLEAVEFIRTHGYI